MENVNKFKFSRRRWAVQLAPILGLALLFPAVLLWGLRGVTPASADPGAVWVDGATGSDDSDCSNPADPCATIGYALGQAGSGDTIRVTGGTYTEIVTIADGETVTLRGGYTISGTEWLRGTGETIVDGNGVDRTFLIHGNNSVLENLTITGGDTPDGQCWGGGIWVTNGDVTIRDSLVTGNWADCSGGGIEVNNDWGPAHLTLVDSIVRDNQSGGHCGGVSVWHAGAHLTNTLIVSNTGSNGSALRIEDSDVTVQNCTIADNQGGDAINAYDTDAQPDGLTIRSSIVWGNTDGDLNCNVETCNVTYSDIGGGWTGTGNIDAAPWFVDPADGDYHLLPWSPCIDSGTADGAPDHDFEGDARPQNAGFDMGADEFTGTPVPPGLLFVDGATGSDSTECRNPAAPCETIGYALTQAGNGDEIRVAQGTYTENLEITQGNTITLRGGYVISGTAWIPTESGATVINGNRADSTIEIRYESNTTLENIAVTGGQGIDDPTFGAGCGGFKIQDSDVTIRGSSIISNVAGVGDGGAICAAGDSRSITLTVEDSIISDNDGGSRGGALNLYNTTASISNTLIYGNRADNNDVLKLYAGDPAASHVTFQNCTIADNNPTGGWSIEIPDLNTLAIRNSIMWGNGQNINIIDPCPDCVTVTYSDIEGGWAGMGNIDTTPWFVDPANGDYHLLPWSPCIDVGTATGAPDHDFEGDPRPQNAGFDMGADEFTGTPMPNEGPRYVATNGSYDANSCVDPGAPCATIGHAAEMANARESVLVAQGTYTENLSISRPVTLTGGYESTGWTRDFTQYETVIDGSGGQTVVTFESDGILDGLTITGGSSWLAGGVDAGGSEVTIKNCLIRDNFADGSPTAEGGGGVVSNGRLIILDTLIVDNEVNDGASGVRGGGGSHLTMVNTLVANNRGAEGLHLNGGADLMNVTIASNAAGTDRPGINFNPQTGGNLVVVNSIVYGNGTGDAFHVDDPNLIQATYSDIQGAWTGTGNVDADPMFADAASGDYHLGVGSPCIDKGTSAGAPAADVEGTPRDAAPDMGAYEWTGFRIFLPLTLKKSGQ